MASILNVDQINNAAGTSGIALDASTGKASFPNSVTIPNGATMPAGSVLQVKHNIYSTWTTTTSTSYAAVNTGFAQSITPTSTSNEILISITAAGLYMASVSNTIIFALYRDGSLVVKLDAACRHVTAGNGGNGAWTFKETAPSTSAVNYQVYWKCGIADTIGVNNYTGSTVNGDTKSSITVTEIAQ